ncbi:7280_t:CDS:2 [Cetraspora pellucida]|uniref:7280_t:CDS:1 n=1 Tax=Cetraspora pellucida TaxID=1433469 RepID=A0A9N9A3W5_9GLOM|nr:7280_t:CDS:2 [Cetraspora pellucida]
MHFKIQTGFGLVVQECRQECTQECTRNIQEYTRMEQDYEVPTERRLRSY